MDFLSPIIVLVIFINVILFITRPFFKSDVEQGTFNPELSKNAYQLVLNRIRELEIEHQEGKINDEDYTARREEHLIQAVGSLKQNEIN